MNETACVSYTADDDDIKEDTEQLTLRLISHDDFVCLCRDFGTISIFEDATDGTYICQYTYTVLNVAVFFCLFVCFVFFLLHLIATFDSCLLWFQLYTLFIRGSLLLFPSPHSLCCAS